jgi:hypothetical protein
MPDYSHTIFTQTYDLLAWLMAATAGFPKSQRFVLAKRLTDTALDFYELVVGARRRPDPGPVLFEADQKLEMLRLYTRLCADGKLKLLSPAQYEEAARRLDEIGRLLGSWIKRTRERAPA